MSQELETVLQKSLDAVDRRRRRLTWLLMIAGAMIAWEFYHLTQIAPSGDVPRMIIAAVTVLFFSILGLGVLVVFQLTVAMRRILRAIELAAGAPSSR